MESGRSTITVRLPKTPYLLPKNRIIEFCGGNCRCPIECGVNGLMPLFKGFPTANSMISAPCLSVRRLADSRYPVFGSMASAEL